MITNNIRKLGDFWTMATFFVVKSMGKAFQEFADKKGSILAHFIFQRDIGKCSDSRGPYSVPVEKRNRCALRWLSSGVLVDPVASPGTLLRRGEGAKPCPGKLEKNVCQDRGEKGRGWDCEWESTGHSEESGVKRRAGRTGRRSHSAGKKNKWATKLERIEKRSTCLLGLVLPERRRSAREQPRVMTLGTGYVEIEVEPVYFSIISNIYRLMRPGVRNGAKVNSHVGFADRKETTDERTSAGTASV